MPAVDMKQALRIVALVLLLPLVAGFGLCGVVGVVAGVKEGAVMLVMFGLAGLPIALGLGALWRSIFRALRDREP